MGKLHREWIKSVALKGGLNADAVESAGGELFTSGSYRLGVHEPGADIGALIISLSLYFIVDRYYSFA
jgi:poly(A) polymerase